VHCRSLLQRRVVAWMRETFANSGVILRQQLEKQVFLVETLQTILAAPSSGTRLRIRPVLLMTRVQSL